MAPAIVPIQHTRALLSAALDGSLDAGNFRPDDSFGLLVPEACPGVPAEMLMPRNTWADKRAYDDTAQDLIGRFQANFLKYADHVDEKVRAAAPVAVVAA